MNVELRRTRQAAWLEQALRVPGVRGVPIYARGRDASRYLVEYTADQAITLRSESARARLARGIGGPVYVPAQGTTEAPTSRLAPDWARAVVDAQLADIDGTRTPGLYLVYPEMASADWAELKHLAPHVPAVRVPALPDPQTVADALAELPVSLVPERVMLASAADPGRYNRTARKLERATTLIFATDGQHHPSPDVFNQRHRRYHVRPDAVAFRGVKRAPLPTACRYERHVTDTTAVDERGVIVLVTRLTWHYWCHCEHQGRQACACSRRGWRGHQPVTFPRPAQTSVPKQAKREQARQARGEATAARGRNVTAWTMSERSLARAAVRHADTVRAVDSLLRMAAEGTTVTFEDGTAVTILGGGQVRDSHRGRAYPVREWARRAAIGGLTIQS